MAAVGCMGNEPHHVWLPLLMPQVLMFLEDMAVVEESRPFMGKLSVKLLEPLLEQRMLATNMPGDVVHSQKLRSLQVSDVTQYGGIPCWAGVTRHHMAPMLQAVAIMVSALDAADARRVFELLVAITRTVQLSSVREYLDLSMINLAHRFPVMLMPLLFHELEDVDLLLQPVSSYLFVAVQVLREMADGMYADPPVFEPTRCLELEAQVIPLYVGGCTDACTRALALMNALGVIGCVATPLQLPSSVSVAAVHKCRYPWSRRHRGTMGRIGGTPAQHVSHSVVLLPSLACQAAAVPEIAGHH